MTHTPGPWRVTDEISRFSGGEVIRPNRGDGIDSPVAYVADFNRYDRDAERQANARLIAEAPALLAALKRLQGTSQQCWEHDATSDSRPVRDPSVWAEWIDAIETAEAAIAKAEGREVLETPCGCTGQRHTCERWHGLLITRRED